MRDKGTKTLTDAPTHARKESRTGNLKKPVNGITKRETYRKQVHEAFKTAKPQRILYGLIACEESQAECIAFRELGHIVYSCDLQSARYCADWHIKQDVTPFLEGQTEFITESGLKSKVPRWDFIIAHPPCTYLCRLSICQLKVHNKMNWSRYRSMILGRRFFMKCLDAKAHYLAVENPVPQSRAQLPKPTCYASPHWYGIKYTKKTCYWLKNLPPLWPKIINVNTSCYVSSSRGKYRSRTFEAMAKEIARQWSDYIINDMQR